MESFSVRGVEVSAAEGVRLPDIVISAHTNSPGFSMATLRGFALNGKGVNPLEAFSAVTNAPGTRRLCVR